MLLTVNEQVNDAIEVVLLKRRLKVDASKLVPESNVYDDLGFDSLNTVELALELEWRFDIVVSDDDAERIKTYGDIIALVKTRTNG